MHTDDVREPPVGGAGLLHVLRAERQPSLTPRSLYACMVVLVSQVHVLETLPGLAVAVPFHLHRETPAQHACNGRYANSQETLHSVLQGIEYRAPDAEQLPPLLAMSEVLRYQLGTSTCMAWHAYAPG